MKAHHLVMLGLSACAAIPKIPAAAAPATAMHVQPRCERVDLHGDEGGDGDRGDPGVSGFYSGDSGGRGGDGNDGFPGQRGPEVEIALGYAGTQAVAQIASPTRRRDVVLDPTCPPLAVRARGGDGGDGGDGGNGGAGGTATSLRRLNDGPSGPDGKDGDGGDGARGGDGGTVIVRYDRAHPELLDRITIDVRGGIGGAGGASDAKAGEPGDPGADGPPTQFVPVEAATLFPASVATAR